MRCVCADGVPTGAYARTGTRMFCTSCANCMLHPNSRASQVVIHAVVGALETQRYPFAQNFTLVRVVLFVLCLSVVICIALIRSTFGPVFQCQRAHEHPDM